MAKQNGPSGVASATEAQNKSSNHPQDTTPSAKPQDGESTPKEKLTKRQRHVAFLMEALQANGHAFRLSAGDTWITLKQPNGIFQTMRLPSRGVGYWLVNLFHNTFHDLPDAKFLDQIADLHAAHAQFNGPEHDTYLRLAPIGPQELWVDLGAGGECVRITPGKWTIERQPSTIPFYRPPGYLPMPRPVHGGSIHEIRRFLNCPEGDPASEANYRLMLMWLVGAYHVDADQVILMLNGEQGSGKTTVNWTLRQFVDPNTADASIEPKTPDDVMFQATHSWVCAYDNLRTIAAAISDALCRISTGAAYSKRKLFTDDVPLIWSFRRPVILNGIDVLIPRSDLRQRALIVNLPTLEGSQDGEPRRRMSKERFKRELREAQPRILGGLFDIIADILLRFPTIEAEATWINRMGDFHNWCRAAEAALGWEPGTVDGIMHQWERAVERATTSDHPVLETLADYMSYGARGLRSRRLRNSIPVTMEPHGVGILTMQSNELLGRLREFAREEQMQQSLRGWPDSEEHFSRLLRASRVTLATLGLTITDAPRSHGVRRLLIRYDPARALDPND